MPKEKIIFIVGVWIVVLSHFIGMPTEIKNYLFVGTGVLIIFISYWPIIHNHKKEKEITKEEKYSNNNYYVKSKSIQDSFPSSYFQPNEENEVAFIKPKRVRRKKVIEQQIEERVDEGEGEIKINEDDFEINNTIELLDEEDDVIVVSRGRKKQVINK